MSLSRRTRYLYWIISDLAHKHTRSLLFGFILGFTIALTYWRLSPFIISAWFTPTDRIGVVGDFTTDTLPLFIQNKISSGLTDLADDGSAIPGLASSWEVTDSGKLYLFHIRSDAEWHDGSPVTAADVNYNIQNVTLKPLDEHTLQVTLQSPFSPFPVLVSKPIFKTGLIGAGPYKVKTIRFKGDSIQSITLVPVEPETGLRPKEYRFYRTENLAILAYKLGEVDILQDISNPKELSDWGNNKIAEHTHYDRIVALFFNMQDTVVSGKSFRQALGYALPVFPYEPASSPISKTSWAYSDNIKQYEHDEAQAKKLLNGAQEATESPHLTITTFANYLDEAQAIANSWAAIGVKTDVRVENSVPDTYQVLLTTIDLPPDPDQYSLWQSTQQSTNISNYVNFKIDKLLEDGRTETDPEERKKIYADFQRRLTDDAPALFLYYPKTYTVYRR